MSFQVPKENNDKTSQTFKGFVRGSNALRHGYKARLAFLVALISLQYHPCLPCGRGVWSGNYLTTENGAVDKASVLFDFTTGEGPYEPLLEMAT